MGNFLYAVESANVVKGVYAGRETAVKTENLIFDERGQGEVVEEVGEMFPDGRVAVFAEAFVVETVNLGNLAGFVVTAKDGDAMGIADFEGDEKGDGFDGEVTTVDIIT